MLGSMYSAVSGLQAHQTKMNVIGNNIANVNTYGFKSSRVTFSDVFYQTINGASAPNNNVGGTNPTQLGYGAKVNSIDVINTRAGSATTDRALDVYINGDGYLPVMDNSGLVKYTRVGILSFDKVGNLVDTNGNKVLGLALNPSTKNPSLGADGTTDIKSLVAIKVEPEDLKKYTGISIGQNGEITAIKDGDPAFTPAAGTGWMSGSTQVSSSSLFNGNVTMSINQNFTPVGYAGTNPVTVSANAKIDTATDPLNVTFSAPDTYQLTYTGTAAGQTATGTLDTTTIPQTVTFTGIEDATGGNSATLTIPIDTNPITGAGYDFVPGTPFDIGDVDPATFDVTITTFDKSGAAVTLVHQDWTSADSELIFTNPSGRITLTVDPAKVETEIKNGFEGIVIGKVGPGPGKPEKIAHMATVNFINSDGLSQSGEGYFADSTNSGDPVATIPGNGGTGSFRSGALEMSNVDLSREFTEMIIAQRGFQANTRMITVSDEMLSELVSMKR